MIQLIPIPATHIDRAWWKDGAHRLSEACDKSGGEITGDQLKMMLSRGERSLVGMRRDGEFVGWGVIFTDQRPNFRVLHVAEMWAPGAGFPEFFEELKKYADASGHSRIRFSAQPAQARLYKSKLGCQSVYETLEVVL